MRPPNKRQDIQILHKGLFISPVLSQAWAQAVPFYGEAITRREF